MINIKITTITIPIIIGSRTFGTLKLDFFELSLFAAAVLFSVSKAVVLCTLSELKFVVPLSATEVVDDSFGVSATVLVYLIPAVLQILNHICK